MLFSAHRKNTIIHRLDPASKLFWLVCVSLFAVFVNNALIQILVAVHVLIVALLLARIPRAQFWRGIRYFVIMSTVFFFIQLLVVPGRSLLVQVGGFSVTWEALELATASALTMFTIIMASIVFVTTTDPKQLAIILHRRLRVPYVLAYLIFAGLRFVPLVEQVLVNIREAQAVRGVGFNSGGLRGKLREARRYTIPLLATSFQRGRVTSWAMDSRGFRVHPDRTYLQSVEIGRGGKLLSVGVALLAGAFLLASMLGWSAPTLNDLFGAR